MTNRTHHDDPLYNAIAETTVQVGRFGFALLRLPLGLLPNQSRTHIECALYELSRGFAGLPGDFARIVEPEIKRWIDETPLPSTSKPRPVTEQHLTVTITLASVTALGASTPAPDNEPIEEDVAELLTEEVAGSIVDIERLVAEPPNVSVAYIEYDPPGSDLEGEFVVITNASHEPVDLTDWTLVDEGNKHTYTFPAFTLAGGAEVKLWTKSGIDDATNLCWGARRPIWNNTGDSAVLRDANGNPVSRYTYAAGA
ncbi:lamin tail domain-containing protein [Chloroflexus sp.]|uniref:lamin tail domain-containing protein n=1 Tax=Chloroflexus sp. TaxID=1904827 RepID=UPI00404A8510